MPKGTSDHAFDALKDRMRRQQERIDRLHTKINQFDEEFGSETPLASELLSELSEIREGAKEIARLHEEIMQIQVKQH